MLHQVSYPALKGGWKVADEEDDPQYVKLLDVKLSIVENPGGGFLLIMEPEGRFASDLFFDAQEEARKDAARFFGVADDSWRIGSPG